MPPKRGASNRSTAKKKARQLSESGSESDASMSPPPKKNVKKTTKGGNNVKNLDPRADAIAEFEKVVGDHKKTIASLDEKVSMRAQRIDEVLDSLLAPTLDMEMMKAAFDVRQAALEKLKTHFVTTTNDDLHANLTRATTYFTKTRPAKIAAAGADLEREVQRTVQKTESQADIKNRAHDMIHGLRVAMRVAAAAEYRDRERNRSYSRETSF